MPRAIGADSRLLTIPEATYGTAPGGNWRRLPFRSCDLGAEQPLLDADVIGIAASRDPAAPFLDSVTVQGQAVVPVDLVNIGHWLRLPLGPPTASGTNPNLTHTFVPGVATLPSQAIEIGYPDVPSSDVCVGVRAEVLGADPFSGAVLVIRSRRTERIKILLGDESGLVLVWKQLEASPFRWPAIVDGVVRLTPLEFAALFDGIDWRRAQPGRVQTHQKGSHLHADPGPRLRAD